MITSRPLTFLTNFVATIALACSALLAGSAAAEVYQSKLKNGKVEMRDFPCNVSSRPAAPVSQLPPPQPTSQLTPNSSSYGSPQNFDTSAQYETARNICMRLTDQYDLTAPMMRCELEDLNCFRRANQELSAIFQQLTHIYRYL